MKSFHFLTFLGLCSGLMILGTTLPSLAEPSPTPQWLAQRGPNLDRQERMMESLNLTAQQKQDLNAIRKKYQGRMEQVYSQLRTRQDELRQLMGSNASDTDIRNKHNQVSALQDQLGELRFDSMLESRKVLTPDQRKQFAQLMEERRSRKGMSRQAPPSN